MNTELPTPNTPEQQRSESSKSPLADAVKERREENLSRALAEDRLSDEDAALAKEQEDAEVEAMARKLGLTPETAKQPGDIAIQQPTKEQLEETNKLLAETETVKGVELVYFKKALIDRPFAVNKVPVKFEPLAQNTGVAVFDAAKDGDVIAALENAAKGKRGGIVKIDKAKYDELKKKLALQTSEQKPRRSDLLRIAPTQAPTRRTPHPNQSPSNRNGSAAGNDNISPAGGANGVVGGGTAGERGGLPASPPMEALFSPTLARGGNLRPRKIPELPDAK